MRRFIVVAYEFCSLVCEWNRGQDEYEYLESFSTPAKAHRWITDRTPHGRDDVDTLEP